MSGPPGKVVIHAVGDIGFGSRLRREAAPATGADPFKGASEALAGADILFGNLETPLVPDGMEPVMPEIRRGFAGAPEHARHLSAHGFRIVSVANNHIMDYGPEGLATTLAALEAEGILHVGAGEDIDAARRPVMVEARGRRIAFLAYATEGAHSAARKRPGAAPLRIEQILSDVAAARESAAAVVVSLHFGLIYSDYPRPEDQAIARGICRGGAAAVIGHHPHVMQGMEMVGEALVAYSLGEFLFDPAGGHVVNRAADRVRREAGVLRFGLLDGAVTDYRLLPTERDDGTLFPVTAAGERGEAIKERIAAISAPLAAGALDGAEILRATARRTAEHQWDVFRHHLLRGHLGIIGRWLLRVRPRHIRMGIRAVMARLRPGPRS